MPELSSVRAVSRASGTWPSHRVSATASASERAAGLAFAGLDDAARRGRPPPGPPVDVSSPGGGLGASPPDDTDQAGLEPACSRSGREGATTTALQVQGEPGRIRTGVLPTCRGARQPLRYRTRCPA